MQRFSSMMATGLTRAGHAVRVCRPPVWVGRLGTADSKRGRWLGYIDKFAAFPGILRAAARWADVVHICDHSNSFYVRQIRKRPHVVTCHDMLGIRSAIDETPLLRTGWTGTQLQKLIFNGLTGSQHIACVSEATRKELLRLTQVPEQRVSRIYNGLNHPYAPMAEHDAAPRLRVLGVDPERPFLFHVGGNTWYKNRIGVLQIFAALRKRTGATGPTLVMAGKPWTPEMRSFVSEHDLSDAVKEIRGATEDDLQALYSMARVMLFPSLEEGFGWPILEAQACGCVVVTSDRSPMNEVGGTAAVYVDPEDIEGAATTVERVLHSAPQQREMSVRNASRFSTEQMIQSYVNLYEKVSHEHS